MKHAPKRETKAFSLSLTSVKANENESEAEFEGYASVFGNVDQGGDKMMQGAFTKTLQESKGRTSLLADHDFTLKGRLGVAYVSQDAKGLLVKGHINLETQAGRETHAHLKQAEAHGMDLGMSFGYAIPKGKSSFENGVRLIHEVKLYEVTITQFPMNTAATVTSVKSVFSEELERISERRQLDAEYWTIMDAFWGALDSFFYDGGTVLSLEESLGDFTATLTGWATRYSEGSSTGLKEQHRALRPHIKALLNKPPTTPDPHGQGEPEGTSEKAASEASEQDSLAYLLKQLQEVS